MKSNGYSEISQYLIPLFDYTHNHLTKDGLESMLYNKLSSMEEILDRQEILKALMMHEQSIGAYRYSKIDFHDCYNLMQAENLTLLRSKDLPGIYFQPSRKNQLLGRLIQMIVFLKMIKCGLLDELRQEVFPKSYVLEIRQMIWFLEKFNLEKNHKLIITNRFGLRASQRLVELIFQSIETGETRLFFDRLIRLECYIAMCLGIAERKFCFPKIVESGIVLQDFFHPNLRLPVSNTFSDRHNLILLTGANMSGKSTLLKAVGLCVYMAHIGLAVPAGYAEIPYFDHIFFAINHDDDLSNGYSHFMNEIQKLKSVLVHIHSGQSCFAIFDELFKGTNQDDALKITQDTLEGLVRFKNSVFVISTHLHALQHTTMVRSGEAGTYYLDCHVVDGAPVFSYRVREGWSNIRIGQILFQREGLYSLLGSGKD